ncbi:MAG: type II secretion system F family protein [Acidimicrobiia bacterium]|nr:type II secretion system F family protein [Acidimicrobiia bacterium]
MIVLAALASAVAVGLGVGLILGVVPRERTVVEADPQVDPRQQWLIQAGLGITPRQFRVASLGVGVLAFAFMLLLTGLAAVALVAAALVAVLPRAFYSRRRALRMSEVQKSWPDGLRDLIASVTAGMSLQRAVENLALTGPAPIREAFARFPYLARTLGMVPALEVVKEELADPTSDRVIEILILAHQRGGAIVPEILRDLADATVRDVWTLEEIETQSLEQKINARAVFILPWFVLVAITARPGPFRDFYASGGGLLVVVFCGVLSGFGMWLVSRLGAEPDEPRVLGGAARVGGDL